MGLNNMKIKDALAKAWAGEHVLVVCKSEYEAAERADALHTKLVAYGGPRRGGHLEVGAGSIEFGWAKTSTGRRLDDFAATAFEIVDPYEVRGKEPVA